MRQRLLRAGGTLCALVFAVTAGGVTEAGEVRLVSAADPGLVVPQFMGESAGGGASQDGRYVVFASSAPNVIPGQSDSNGEDDVFLRDRVTGTTLLVSHSYASSSTTGTHGAERASISADGRWVSFFSEASNLVTGMSGNVYGNTYLFDRVTGTTVLVSHAAGSAASANGFSSDSVLSADGSYLAFTSTATNLAAGQVDANGGYDVFLYDRAAGASTLVSHAPGSPATAGSGMCSGLSLSADGRYLAFGCGSEVFLYDRVSAATTLVSRSAASPTTPADGSSSAPRISADGGYVAFHSHGADLVTGQVDTPGEDVFLFDRVAGTNTLVSRTTAAGGVTCAGGQFPSVSADGRHVAFVSLGTGLVSGLSDSNGAEDAFLFDRTTGAVSLVSRTAASAAVTGNGFSWRATVSADGNYVAFESRAEDLVPGQTEDGMLDVFLHDRAAGTTELASLPGATPDGPKPYAWLTGLSADGTAVVYTYSTINQLDPDDPDTWSHALVYDRGTEAATTLSPLDPVTGLTGNGGSFGGMTSADGRWATFASTATDLVPGMVDANGAENDIFLYDRVTGTRTLVSHAAGSPTTSGNKRSTGAAIISADGRWITFLSQATDLVPGMTSFPLTYQVYLYERETGTITLVSRRNGSPTQGATSSSFDAPSLSADGRFVAWSTLAWDLIPGVTDNHGGYDVYLFDRVTGVITLVSRTSSSASTTGNGTSQNPWISADGRYVAFWSGATDLVPGQTDANGGGNDIFLYDRVTGSTTLVSRSAASPVTTGNSSSTGGYPSVDGRFIVFDSTATDLVAGQIDTNGLTDSFLFDRETGTTTLVSHVSGSPVTTGNGFTGSISWINADGRWISYRSYATNLVAGVTDINGGSDVFLYDRLTGTSTLVSRSSGSPAVTAAGSSSFGLVSADGSRVVFYSDATDLVPGQDDSNGTDDIFLYDRATGGMTLVTRVPGSPERTGNNGSIPRWLSADGLTVSFTSGASDLTPSDFNGTDDVFLFTVAPGSFFTLPACRLLDTRQPQDGPALASDVPVILSLHGVCGIPATARAVAVNVAVTQPTGSGYLVFYPGDVPPPAASTINFGPGQTRANNAILPLALNGTGTLRVSPAIAGGGTVHLLLDVTGYFE